MTTAASAHKVWYCRACRCAARVEPADPNFPLACRCRQPVLPLRPTRVSVYQAPPARHLQALTEEEARLRSLSRRGTRVRVTYEGQIAEAWTATGMDGAKHPTFIVETSDGRRHAVNPELPGVHIERTP